MQPHHRQRIPLTILQQRALFLSTSEGFIIKTAQAVIFNFLITGEAVKQLPEKTKREHPEIPWRQIAGMRDKRIHAYFSIDYELVWKTMDHLLPQFRTVIEGLLEKIDWRSPAYPPVYSLCHKQDRISKTFENRLRDYIRPGQTIGTYPSGRPSGSNGPSRDSRRRE